MIALRPALPQLDDDDVHVWMTDTRGPITAADRALLSADEHDRADRFRLGRDQCCYVVTRAVARRLLAGYLGTVDPAELVFGYGAHGKPYLERLPQALFFNASHSGERAAIAITRAGDVGVDVERLDRVVDHERLAARVFSARELATFRAQPEALHRAAFFDGWTRKEAFIKATGEGLWRSMQTVDVELTPGAAARVVAVDGSADDAACWTLAAFDPAPGYVGAVAVQARGARVRRFEYGDGQGSGTPAGWRGPGHGYV